MEIKLNALCVRTIDYKDNDKLLTLCTLERGKILVKATGCKLPKAKLKSYASPLCFGEYILVEHNDRYTLKGCDLIDSFSGLVSDLSRYFAGFSILECVEKLSKKDDVESCCDLTILAVHALKDLAYSDTFSETILVNFLIKALQASGYELNFAQCAYSQKDLFGKKIGFDFAYSGIVLYEYRTMNFLELTPEIVSILKGEETNDKIALLDAVEILDKILSSVAYVSPSYSVAEFIKITRNQGEI